MNNDTQQPIPESPENSSHSAFTHEELSQSIQKEKVSKIVKLAAGVVGALALTVSGYGVYKNAQLARNMDSSLAATPITYPDTYPTAEFTDLSAIGYQYQAQFNFYFTASSSAFIIDIASDSAMTAPVKFASGVQSPLMNQNPLQFKPTYDCGKTVYWRVRTADSLLSPIFSPTQTLQVICATPTPPVSSSLIPTKTPAPTIIVDPSPSSTPTKPPTPTLKPSPTPIPTFGLSFEAEAGIIQAPFLLGSEVARKYILQNTQSTAIAENGKATYRFKVDRSDKYIIKATVRARNSEENSFFVNIDGEPTSPKMIWDIKPTRDFTARTVTWRNSGKPESNYGKVQRFSLSAGIHSLIIRGREPQTLIDKITIERN